MAQIPFDHDGCNAWAIYTSQSIYAEDAKNMHVAEGILRSEGGEALFRPNSKNKTICGANLKKIGRELVYCSVDSAKIRLKLTELQNRGKEVCGVCASRFFVDVQ